MSKLVAVAMALFVVVALAELRLVATLRCFEVREKLFLP